MFPILSIITFLPLLGGIAILFIPKEHVSAMRWTALAVAWMDLLLALVLILGYSQANVTASSPIVGSAQNGEFLYFLGSDVDTGLFPGWRLGRRPPYLRGIQVRAVYFGR